MRDAPLVALLVARRQFKTDSCLHVTLWSSLKPQSRTLLLLLRPHEAPTQTNTQSCFSPHVRRSCCFHDVTTVFYCTLQDLRVCKHERLMLSACFLYKSRRKFCSFLWQTEGGGLYFRGQISPLPWPHAGLYFCSLCFYLFCSVCVKCF